MAVGETISEHVHLLGARPLEPSGEQVPVEPLDGHDRGCTWTVTGSSRIHTIVFLGRRCPR